jgi:hypothetical protein
MPWAWFGSVLLTIALAASASAQTTFQFLLTQGSSVAAVAGGSTLTFSSEVGRSQSAQLQITYLGVGRASIQTPALIGSPAFTATLAQGPPVSLDPGSSVVVNLAFLPTSSSPASALLNLLYTETVPTTNNQTTTTRGAIVFTLQGGSPSIVLSYMLASDLNSVQLPAGGSVVFPPTQINTVASATFNITNRGNGPGTVLAVSLTGAAFRLSGLPLFPVSLNVGQQLSLTLQYSPQAIQTDAGSIQVTLDSGPVSVSLQGSGSGSSFTYDVLVGDSTVALAPNGTLSLPDTALADTGSVVVRVHNSGNGNGQVTSILLAGAGFAIANAPALPQTLAPSQTLSFTLTFKPPQAGTSQGTLRIGDDVFNLVGNGIGARLAYSYTSAGIVVSIDPGGTITFSPQAFAQTVSLQFTLRNSGTQAATVANVGIVEPQSPFTLAGLPGLPANLAPNSEFHFSVVFTPKTSGFANATLRIDAATFTLTGSSLPPPPLPAYSIDGPSGTVAPLTQPAFGITLSTPYSLELSGTLVVTENGDFGSDPSVQFSSGSRAVNFLIPPNQTQAIFANQATQIRLQTGTVSGVITLTAGFVTLVGGVEVTQSSPVSQSLTVAPSAPVLQTLAIDNLTATGFTLAITGFSTTRSLGDLNVAFTGAPGFNLANSQVTFHMATSSTVWFQSVASQAFGGQFTTSIPFTFQSSNGAASPTGAIKSVSVTATNERGTSNSLQMALQ